MIQYISLLLGVHLSLGMIMIIYHLFYVLLADSTVDLFHFWVETFHVISEFHNLLKLYLILFLHWFGSINLFLKIKETSALFPHF